METISVSRIKLLETCPRKHYYKYDEKIKTQQNESLYLGSLFHKTLEAQLQGNIVERDCALEEYRQYCMKGCTTCDPDLFQYLISRYMVHYKDLIADEEVIDTEIYYEDSLEKDYQFVIYADMLVYNKSMKKYKLVDFKTTRGKLKYTYDDVVYDQQLLTYVPYVEHKYNIKIDLIEIDEIRLSRLNPVPFNANGKPSADRNRLELVDADEYLECLETQGLIKDKAYQNAIDWISKRGDPLFNRIQVQILDRNLIASTMQANESAFEAIKIHPSYRAKGEYCAFCEYKQLCELDRVCPSDISRKYIIENIEKIILP